MDAAANRRWFATGYIKKVFTGSRHPYGFLTLCSPVEFHGQEASFYFRDVQVPDHQMAFVQPGIAMQFAIIEKPVDSMRSFVPFKAEQVRPLDQAEYPAAVHHETGESLFVELESTMIQARISDESYKSLANLRRLQPGHPCVVKIAWQEMVDSMLYRRTPICELISFNRTWTPGCDTRPRRTSENVEFDLKRSRTPCEEEDSQPRPQKPNKKRSKSLGDRAQVVAIETPPAYYGQCYGQNVYFNNQLQPAFYQTQPPMPYQYAIMAQPYYGGHFYQVPYNPWCNEAGMHVVHGLGH